MNKTNTNKLWKIIQEAGDYLVGQLPDHPNHPKGRNPYAHVAICVKSQFKASYKDIPDEQFDEVIKYIKFLKQNPSSYLFRHLLKSYHYLMGINKFLYPYDHKLF